MPKMLDAEDVETMKAMRLGGYSTREVAKALDVSLSTVSKYCLQINEDRRSNAIVGKSSQYLAHGTTLKGRHSNQ